MLFRILDSDWSVNLSINYRFWTRQMLWKIGHELPACPIVLLRKYQWSLGQQLVRLRITSDILQLFNTNNATAKEVEPPDDIPSSVTCTKRTRICFKNRWTSPCVLKQSKQLLGYRSRYTSANVFPHQSTPRPNHLHITHLIAHTPIKRLTLL